jgi:hypothetical protein
MIVGMRSHLVSESSEPMMKRIPRTSRFLRVRNLPSRIRKSQSALVDPSSSAVLYDRADIMELSTFEVMSGLTCCI